jgi:hypothetical protein
MSYLMTELWDHAFSQIEIRDAFLQALEDNLPGLSERSIADAVWIGLHVGLFLPD